MRVLQVYKVYRPEDFTGVPRVVHSIAEGVAAHSIQTVVLATSQNKRLQPVQVGSHHVHLAKRNFQIASTSFSWEMFGKFAKLAQSVDIIHYHFPWPAGDLLEMATHHNRPYVVTYHSDIVKQKVLSRFYSPLMNRFLSKADSIVATSSNYANTSLVLQKFKHKVSTIPIGIPGRPPLIASQVEKWRERLGDGFVLFVGSLRYYKGIEHLVAAARLTNAQIVIAGEGSIENFSKHPLPANVTHLKNVSDDDKESLLELCRVFVLPSHLRSEAFGISLLEAARAGKPMISCEIGTGTSFVNVDGLTGFTAKPADPNSIKNTIELLISNQDLSAKLGANARIRFEELFTTKKMACSYAELYNQLLNKRIQSRFGTSQAEAGA